MSQAFDRSKFRATQAATLKQADKETESIVRNRDFTSADYLKIEEGANKFRIYPFHPGGGGEAFAETKVIHWLELDVPEYKDREILRDSKGNVITKRAPRPIFNSRVHGNTEKDIIEEYIKYAEKLAKDQFPSKDGDQKKFLEPIYGGYNSKYKGILSKQSWVMYVDQILPNGSKTFGRLDIGKSIKNRLNAISAVEASNQPLGTDPFTDLNDGRAVVITKNSKADPQNYYVTELDSSFDPKTKVVNFHPLSDEDLEKFMKYPSLYSMFRNAYKRSDFDKALDGLKIFDNEHKIGVFQYEEFLDIAEEINNYYPEETLEEDQKTGKDIDKMFTSKNKVTESDREPDVFDDMDRQELKDYCKEEKTGIIVINKMSDDEIRIKVREWYNATQVEEQEEQIEKITKTPKKQLSKIEASEEGIDEGDGLPWDKDGNDIKKSETVVDKATISTKDRVAQIRKNLSKQ